MDDPTAIALAAFCMGSLGVTLACLAYVMRRQQYLKRPGGPYNGLGALAAVCAVVFMYLAISEDPSSAAITGGSLFALGIVGAWLGHDRFEEWYESLAPNPSHRR